ncbi:MAG TPA: pyridoxamine 5'-phosphate oxidase family protein [Parvularculaceae bacterium]|nr:pyridoxamine 5'-phosphate oxidase family protein [Parvularculaceae bacterium]
MTIPMDPETRKVILSILKDAKDITVATNRPDGFPQATVVSFVHSNDVIYFGCGAHSQKARNIDRDNRVSITATPPYGESPTIRGLSIGGRARRVGAGPERYRVIELIKKRFPHIVDYVKSGDCNDIALFRVEPEVISIIDYARGFGHAELHGQPPLRVLA